jgi:hypothetical protein
MKQDKYTKSARGKICTVQLPGCSQKGLRKFFDENTEATATTVLAHLGGGGMGAKRSNIHGAYCCSTCHDIIDGRVNHNYEKEWLEHQHLRGVIKTQEQMLKNGILKL